MQKKYDYLVIGSGPAGYTSAIRASQIGLKVAVVEKNIDMFGGVCLNEGCIPAKSLYNSANIFDMVKRSPGLCGLNVKCGKPDLASFVKRSREAASQLGEGLSFLFKKNGIDLINGKAEFLDSGKVQITDSGEITTTIEAGKFLIASGSTPRELEGIPFDGETVISSSEAIRLEKVPGKMLVIGGGAIGAEMASFFNIIGSEVVIIEMESSILPFEDEEVSRRLQSVFKQKGIEVLTSSRVSEIKTGSAKADVTIQSKGKEVKDKFDIVLISVGRKPSTSGLGLDRIGVKVDAEGYILVDEHMKTNIENVYAAGDVVRTPMLAHLAAFEGELAAESAGGEVPREIDYSSVPNAVYTQVQVASVGITEKEAKEKGLDFSKGKQFFKSNGKAVISSETEGFIKILADNSAQKILGVHIIGTIATELIHEFVLAKRKGLTVEDIERTVHAHPTFSEAAVDAAKSVSDKPIHG